MKKFKIFFGLSGEFGGAAEDETLEFETESEAMDYAYQLACEDYESYAGLHGLRTVDDIMVEDDLFEDDAEDVYIEERESWLDYYVEEVK